MSKNENLTIQETFNLAVKNHQEGKTDIAQDLYNQILKIDPNHSSALNNIAVIFSNLKEHQKAKNCYEKAIAINPNSADALNNLGIIFNELGENQKAKECFEKAIKINPNYADAHNNLGVIFKELKEYQKAKSCIEKALEIDPLNKKYMITYGDTLIFLNDKFKGYDYIKKGQGVIKFTPLYSRII